MQDYKKFFNGKKITVMGLGLLGRGVGYTKFLAECGADLIVTDLKPSTALRSSLEKLRNFKNIRYTLGEHRLEDFQNRDMIIKAAGVPLDSPYIAEARKHGIPIEMDVSLFAKLVPEVMIIGVTGTRGKSMTTTLIYEILRQNSGFIKFSSTLLGTKKPKVFLGGNIRGVATLPLLKKARVGDILVCELDSWQLQGFGDSKISPHISVFTSFMPDHMNYYLDDLKKYFSDKANIFKYQKKDDYLIIRPGMKRYINPVRSRSPQGDRSTRFVSGAASNGVKKSEVKSNLIIVDPKKLASWKFNVPGEHHRENMTCAVEVGKILGIPESKIKRTIANFKDLEGRLQLLRTYKGIKIYNDNNATTPEATIAGIEAIAPKPCLGARKIVLICGGADKNLPLDNFVKVINKYCKAVVLIPGTGTEKLITNYKLLINNKKANNLKDAIKNSLGLASRGDIILFSPAFASFGMFNNEYERNDLFIKIIKNLK